MEPIKASFIHALPVWEEGKAREMNWNLLFTAVVPQGKALARLTGQTHFQLMVNGTFVAAGPARAAHNWYRIDEYDLSALLTQPKNVVSVLVAGYNVNSYVYTDCSAFFCCEILDGETLLAATGVRGFSAVRYTQRVRKIQRYSFQRPFAESYHLDAGYDRALTDPEFDGPFVQLAQTGEHQFLPRCVPYTCYETMPAVESIDRGSITRVQPEKPFRDRSVYEISSTLRGFKVDELEELTIHTAQSCKMDHADRTVRPGNRVCLAANSYSTFRLAKNLTGMVELTVTAEADTTLLLTFDEVYNNGEVDCARMQCSNVVVWHLAGQQTYHLRTFEPYTLQYLNLIALNGAVRVSDLALRRFDFPLAELTHTVAMPTPRLQAIYDAGVETFRQNTLDLFMDCPSRERAGWLCDSFFTSRVERTLTGKSVVEHEFLQNFLLPEHFADIPEGMLPMLYPGDHYDGVFIPNWAMWFVLELEEYLHRTGDTALVQQARQRVYDLLGYFRKFENADGLLEKLESWVFIEWSRSNELVQDINYPSNMLYARMKEAIAHLYQDETLQTEAETLKQTIRHQAFLGDFFCDNAVYDKGGIARLSGEATESCQYYAFFTGVATPQLYPQLWETLVQDFGPNRKQTRKHPEIAFANAFIGNYLRLELLYRNGLFDKILENIDGYFTYMAEKTGTLWENDSDAASCDHGFASHVLYWLNGIYNKEG